MSLETGSRIQDLVPTNPVGATDFVQQGDDHIRLLKVCIQGSLPNLGAGQVTASAEELSILDGATLDVSELNKLDGLLASTAELNFVVGVTSAIQTQLDAKLSIAAAAAGYQPLDSDLTAIAALTTTSYGRGFLDLANDAATATKLAAMVPTWTGLHTWARSSYPTIQITPPSENISCGFSINNASGTRKLELLYNGTGTGGAYGIAAGHVGINGVAGLSLCAADTVYLTISTAGVVKIYETNAGALRDAATKSVTYSSPGGTSYTLAAADNNSIRRLNGITTLNCPAGLESGSNGTILNDSGAACTIQGSSGGRIFNFTGATRQGPASRTLAYGGVMSWVTDGSDFFVFGSGIS